ncbi:MAG: sigma-70 family RNA polymerase sigma factor [Proteobacteria bacterium]|nr:sigma-70 family RNA polymerase sigma factor [Pseudomonadota bacterium]
METVYALDAHLEEIISVEENEPLINSGHDAAADTANGSTARSTRDARDKDILSAYLKELRTSVLLTPQEEITLGKESVEQEKNKQELTGQLMLLVARLVNKRRLLAAPVGAHPIVRACMTAASLQQKIKTLERSIQKSVSGSYERRKLNRSRAKIVSEFCAVVSQVDLRALKDRAILREIKPVGGVNSRQKVKAEKEFLRMVQEIETAEARSQGARARLVKSNLRLVVGLARRYLSWGMPLADIIQEGNIGLMRAAEKFDYRLGGRFSTYASWWIRQAIVRCIDGQRSSIRLPVYINERLKKMKKITRQIVQDTGKAPVLSSLVEAMGISPRHVDEIQQILQDTISLETPAGKEDGPLKYFIEDPSNTSPLDEILKNHCLQTAELALQVLTPREQEIIKLPFGIGIDAEHTLEEIGHIFNLSRERIRQLEDKALAKLKRSPSLKRCFEQYF